MPPLQLVINNEKPGDDALDYLLEHYHDYDPEEWDAQYEELTEIAVLEEQIHASKRELIRRRTAKLSS